MRGTWFPVCLALALACAQPAQPPARDVAAPVPTIVATLSDAGASHVAEQGDFIEVRLDRTDDSTWRQSRTEGDARLEPQTQSPGVFRYRALGVGQATLTFGLYAPGSEAPIREVRFTFVVR